MIPSAWIDLAKRRLEGQIEQTPLTYDPALDLFLKWENRQRTGSFKFRGALNKVLSLEPWERQRGLVTASAGNHGQGVALAARQVGAPVIVYASERAVPAKLDAMRALGAEVRLVPGGYEDAERAGLACAKELEATWVSPYNDGQVIAGQATIALEILAQYKEQAGDRPLGAVVAPVGGGGMISGIGAALQTVAPRPALIGVQSDASPFFYALYHHGSQEGVRELESLADGLAGPVENGSITIPLARRYVDNVTLVTEEQIARAIVYAWQKHKERIEGSAAVSLTAVMFGAFDRPPGALAAVISGGNIQPEVHAQICGYEV